MNTSRSVAPFIISRELDAPLELVWKAWTEADRMKHWWGPKGADIVSCANDLRIGGACHYCLRFEGVDMWGRYVYREIAAPRRIVYELTFSDEKGGVTRHPLAENWPLKMLTTLEFSEAGGRTRVNVTWEPIDPTDAECKAFDEGRDGMIQGWTGTFERLEEYLATLR